MSTVCKHFFDDHIAAVRYASVADTNEPCLSYVRCSSPASYLWMTGNGRPPIASIRHKHS